jgi:2-polyprenyl-6-methoxyphenol hydroxylase-like FAD-dependent oxidoreductase
MLALAPAFADRVQGATRVARFVGAAVPNYFRRPYGPGWALVGDAGYNKDFITAQGMQDAFRDADHCATALHHSLSGTRPFTEAMAAYQASRDGQVRAMYEFTTQLATLQPPPPELAQLLAAIHGHQQPMNHFAQVIAGVLPPTQFFSQENVSHMLASAR